MIPLAMAAGAVLGLGLVLVMWGLVPRPPPLADAVAGLRAEGDGSGQAVDVRHRVTRLGARLASAAGLDLDALDADLAITGRTLDQLLFEKVLAAATGLALPPVLAVLARVSGVAAPAGLVVIASLALATAGLVLPDALLRSRANERRRAFVFALSSYLDLVHVILAAGAGVESALMDAALSGRSWPFRELQAALERSRLTGESPWVSFRCLGADIGVPDLVETASSLGLAGTHGARIRASLEARAQSMRARDLSEMEAQAEAASERMTIPAVVLVVGFVVFVGFPAIHEVLRV